MVVVSMPFITGNINTVRGFLNQGMNVNNKVGAGISTPIGLAAQFGHTDIVRLLIRAGANVNIRDINGWTPLMWAATKGYLEIVRLLIQAGANVNNRSNGWSVLQRAIATNHRAVVRTLIQAGAHVTRDILNNNYDPHVDARMRNTIINAMGSRHILRSGVLQRAVRFRKTATMLRSVMRPLSVRTGRTVSSVPNNVINTIARFAARRN